MDEEKEFYSVPEFAKKLGISRIAVFKRVKKGKIQAIRIGRNWAIPSYAGASLVDAKNIAVENTKKAIDESQEAEDKAGGKDSMDDLGWD